MPKKRHHPKPANGIGTRRGYKSSGKKKRTIVVRVARTKKVKKRGGSVIVKGSKAKHWRYATPVQRRKLGMKK